MDDLKYGVRDKRGDWKPNGRIEGAPLWNWPPRLPKILAWLPGYIWPWNAFHMVTALLYWFYIVPGVETMKTIGWGWGPALTWQGWLVYATYALAVLATGLRFPPARDPAAFALLILTATAALVAVCRLKGERPR